MYCYTISTPFDLHVLSTPPAFVLSQNQTLREKFGNSSIALRNESKVYANDLLQLNLTDYFPLRLSCEGRPAMQGSYSVYYLI